MPTTPTTASPSFAATGCVAASQTAAEECAPRDTSPPGMGGVGLSEPALAYDRAIECLKAAGVPASWCVVMRRWDGQNEVLCLRGLYVRVGWLRERPGKIKEGSDQGNRDVHSRRMLPLDIFRLDWSDRQARLAIERGCEAAAIAHVIQAYAEMRRATERAASYINRINRLQDRLAPLLGPVTLRIDGPFLILDIDFVSLKASRRYSPSSYPFPYDLFFDTMIKPVFESVTPCKVNWFFSNVANNYSSPSRQVQIERETFVLDLAELHAEELGDMESHDHRIDKLCQALETLAIRIAKHRLFIVRSLAGEREKATELTIKRRSDNCLSVWNGDPWMLLDILGRMPAGVCSVVGDRRSCDVHLSIETSAFPDLVDVYRDMLRVASEAYVAGPESDPILASLGLQEDDAQRGMWVSVDRCSPSGLVLSGPVIATLSEDLRKGLFAFGLSIRSAGVVGAASKENGQRTHSIYPYATPNGSVLIPYTTEDDVRNQLVSLISTGMSKARVAIASDVVKEAWRLIEPGLQELNNEFGGEVLIRGKAGDFGLLVAVNSAWARSFELVCRARDEDREKGQVHQRLLYRVLNSSVPPDLYPDLHERMLNSAGVRLYVFPIAGDEGAYKVAYEWCAVVDMLRQALRRDPSSDQAGPDREDEEEFAKMMARRSGRSSLPKSTPNLQKSDSVERAPVSSIVPRLMSGAEVARANRLQCAYRMRMLGRGRALSFLPATEHGYRIVGPSGLLRKLAAALEAVLSVPKSRWDDEGLAAMAGCGGAPENWQDRCWGESSCRQFGVHGDGLVLQIPAMQNCAYYDMLYAIRLADHGAVEGMSPGEWGRLADRRESLSHEEKVALGAV